MIVVAIDIGMTGAVACIRPDRSSVVTDLPMTETEADKWLDARALYDILLAWVPVTERCILVVENVRPRSIGNGGLPTNSMHSQGALMRGRGAVEAVASIARWPITWVQPQTWKRHYGLKRDENETDSAIKERGRQMALKLFPEQDQQLKFKYHHNRADALLMAHWGRSTQL
jgi:crossover junction endodeoxyribonuclease RuvC